MKKNWFLICPLFVCCCIFSFAQEQRPPWWYTLEQGKLKYRSGNYGDALLAFEDARRDRQAIYERMEGDFIALLSLSEVRRLGDSLDWVDRFARDRHYAGAVEALDELYYRVPRERLNNSAADALAALGTFKHFPEAEYWLGETYRAEGELNLALSQFQKAREQSALFENPGFELELLYKIAGIHRIRQEYTEMERALYLILAGDRLWSDSTESTASSAPETPFAGTLPAGVSASFARQAMTRTLENDGPDRFLALYRYNNSLVEVAHRLLGFYYYATGRHSRAAEHLMFAFLIQNTTIIEEVIRHQFDFAFTSLEELAEEIHRNPVLSAYAEKVDYYRTVYALGTSLYGNGKAGPAQVFWIFLAGQPRAGEWQYRAAGQLRNPRIERAVEMP